MGKAKKSGLIFVIKTLIESYIRRLRNLTYLASLEAKLAGRTLIKIIILLIIFGFLLASIWFSLLLVIFIYLVSLHYSWLFASAIITFINIFLSSAVFFYILYIKQYLLFPATRKQISNTTIVKKDD
jgi:hypothetical protein